MKYNKLNNYKRISTYLIIIAFLFLAVQVNAQDYLSNNMTIEQKVKSQTDILNNDVSLTYMQYQEAYNINLKYAKEQLDIKDLGKSRKVTNRALKSSEKKKTKEFKLLLDKKQFKEYSKTDKANEEKDQIAEDAIVAKEKAANAELKADKANKKADKARDKSDKARDESDKAREKSDKAASKAANIKRNY